MAKEGDLWDDSALTNAFDQAMSKFKKMHVKGYEESSSGSGEANVKEQSREEKKSCFVETNDCSSQFVEASESEVDNLPVAKEKETLDSQVPGEYVDVPNGIPLQEYNQSYSNSQGNEEYDLLCKQYYELEEKRQRIWEKLQQYGQWDYRYPVGNTGSCMLWPAVSASQNQCNSSQACCPAFAISCCPYACQSSATSCSFSTSAGLCANPSQATGSGRMTGDADIIKKGMEAAEKAISKLKEEASDRQLDVQSCSLREPSSNGETDLTKVLNAWYSAGFYTAKYLTERSLAKPQHD